MKSFYTVYQRVRRVRGTCLLHGRFRRKSSSVPFLATRLPSTPARSRENCSIPAFVDILACPMPRPPSAICAGVSPNLSTVERRLQRRPVCTRVHPDTATARHQSLFRRRSDQRRLPVSQSVDPAERDSRFSPAGHPLDSWWRAVDRLAEHGELLRRKARGERRGVRERGIPAGCVRLHGPSAADGGVARFTPLGIMAISTR